MKYANVRGNTKSEYGNGMLRKETVKKAIVPICQLKYFLSTNEKMWPSKNGGIKSVAWIKPFPQKTKLIPFGNKTNSLTNVKAVNKTKSTMPTIGNFFFQGTIVINGINT